MRRTLPPARWALTPPLHPYLIPCGPSAVCFLLHCLSGRPARPLAGTLSYGARTFLSPLRGSDHLAHSAGRERIELSSRVLEALLYPVLRPRFRDDKGCQDDAFRLRCVCHSATPQLSPRWRDSNPQDLSVASLQCSPELAFVAVGAPGVEPGSHAYQACVQNRIYHTPRDTRVPSDTPGTPAKPIRSQILVTTLKMGGPGCGSGDPAPRTGIEPSLNRLTTGPRHLTRHEAIHWRGRRGSNPRSPA